MEIAFCVSQEQSSLSLVRSLKLFISQISLLSKSPGRIRGLCWWVLSYNSALIRIKVTWVSTCKWSFSKFCCPIGSTRTDCPAWWLKHSAGKKNGMPMSPPDHPPGSEKPARTEVTDSSITPGSIQPFVWRLHLALCVVWGWNKITAQSRSSTDCNCLHSNKFSPQLPLATISLPLLVFIYPPRVVLVF